MLAHIIPSHYPVTQALAKSSAGRRNPNSNRCTSTAFLSGAFLLSGKRYGGWLRAGFGLAGFLFDRYSYPAISRLQSRRKDVGDSDQIGVTTMAIRLFPTLSPSKSRAAAHRAMARSALFSDSSAAVRLKRYNSHMQKARSLEAATGSQEVAQ